MGENLHGTLHVPEEPFEKGAVIGHCFTCSRHTRILSQIGQDLSRAGFLALRFDFSGNGQSEGKFEESSYTKHIHEMKTAAKFVSNEGARWVGLLGHSMGAAIAILTAAQMPSVKAVCALAGRLSSTNALHFLTDEKVAQLQQAGCVSFSSRGRSLRLCEEFFNDADRHDLPARIKAISDRLMIVHGDRDEIVPVKEAKQAYNLNPAEIELAIIPKSDHMFSDQAVRSEVSRLIVNWFLKKSDNR